MVRKRLLMGLAVASCVMLRGAVAEAGTFTTITIDGLFSDWAGIPVLSVDSGDNIGGPDIGDTQIAHDDDYLYIRTTFANNLTLNTFIAVDVDQDAATGFDILDLGIFGSEAGWQNDFGFSQATGVFNSGPLIGDFFGAGHALLAPFGNVPSRELAISLANLNNGGVPTFPDDTIRLMIWTNQGSGADGLPAGDPRDSGLNGDFTVIEYQLGSSSVPLPEPTGLLLLATAGIGGWFFRRGR